MPNLNVETTVDLVRAESHYRGSVTIDGVKFSYDLRFNRPLHELDAEGAGKSEDELADLIENAVRLDVKDPRGQPVSLENDAVKCTFLVLTLPWVMRFNKEFPAPMALL